MVDPFWQKVGEAYEIVLRKADPGNEIAIQMNGKYASLVWSDFGSVSIVVKEVPIDKPTLISP
jgi:hypothetical protein